MLANRREKARYDALDCTFARSGNQTAPRAAFFCRPDSLLSIGFALTLRVLVGILLAVGLPPSAEATSLPNRLPGSATAAERFSHQLDQDGNGIEDLLDQWLVGAATWADLQQAVRPARLTATEGQKSALPDNFPNGVAPASSVVANGRLRVLCLGATAGQLFLAQKAGATSGTCVVLHDIDRFGGVTVLAADEAGLSAFLASDPDCLVLLDRDGVPALVDSRGMVGMGRVTSGDLELGNDWSATVAILDSGMDSAHGDLGDLPDDDIDGPAPAVGDAGDWFSAVNGWPLSGGYKVVGWQDVTDDFPDNQGPWDYHHHGTALASVVAGSGVVDSNYRGIAPGARLTIVKFYDFDETWHAWAGDYLAACAWTLEYRDTYRIRTVLTAVNWEVDAGISTAMRAFVDVGILPVAAMGNYGTDAAGPGYPASLPDVLTAGATNSSGAVSAYSGRGLAGDNKPDLVAPGGGLLIDHGRIVAADTEPNDSYSGRFGTSLAAAHLAGAAYVLDEALLENGLRPLANRAAVKARQAVLRHATAHVSAEESADGTALLSLPVSTGHDAARGGGHLRVDSAVRAMICPLFPGTEQTDTLSSDWAKPAIGRRLGVMPGIRYLVEAVPTGSLDVSLELVEVAWNATGDEREQVLLMDQSAAGVSEFTYFRPAVDTWSFVVVRRISGAGSVVLRVIEEDTFAEQGTSLILPGVGTGAPNIANLPQFTGPSLLVTSRVLVDSGARSLTAFDMAGNIRPGWPVFVFSDGASQGGLTQPMAADLDGVPGDELVVASDYGSVYFFKAGGDFKTVALEFNQRLTAPVGFTTAVGGRRVLVVDDVGRVRTWSWNAAVNADPELRNEVLLARSHALAPAAGQLTATGGESLVVAFADGWLGVFDENLVLRSGWPKELGATLEVSPVLCDLNEDGVHEIVLPVRDEASGQLVMRVFDGAGNSLAADGIVVPSPRGGRWLRLSEAVVSGRYGTGELNVAVAGLADNDLAGDEAAWSIGIGRLFADGSTATSDRNGFSIAASTDQGVLQLDNLLLPTPLAWNQAGYSATEVAALFHIQWHELLYGFTAIPGATTGWLMTGLPNDPFVEKQPLLLGGAQQAGLAYLSGMLVPLESGIHLRVEIIDREFRMVPVNAGEGSVALWRAQRGDSRNSGAFPLNVVVSAAPVLPVLTAGIRAYPNPGSGHIRFQARDGALPDDAELDVFDLRGYRVTQVRGADGAGVMHWNGADDSGRRLAAGTYLAVVRVGNKRMTTRVVLTR